MPRLFVLNGPDLGKIHSFDGSVRLGRTSQCDVIVQGPSISRVHAELSLAGGAWILTDMNSSNGVHLGSVRAKRFELADGDVFRLGKIELRFRVEDAAVEEAIEFADDSSPEPASAAPPAPEAPPASTQPSAPATPPSAPESSEPRAAAPEPPAAVEADAIASEPAPALGEERPQTDERSHSVEPVQFQEPAPEMGGELRDDDEFFIEEEIDLGSAPHGAVAPRSASPPPPTPPRSAATAAAQTSLGAGGHAPHPDQGGQRRRDLQSAARRRTAEVTDRREREILQFSTHRSESSAMTSDLSQHPVWVRVLAVTLALGVSATIFYYAFRGASSLRGETGIDLDPGVGLEDEY